MTKKPLKGSVLLLLLLASGTISAQVKLGDNVNAVDPSALLELSNGNVINKGLLLPKVSLTTTTSWGLDGTGGAAQKGMIVFNTNAAITGTGGLGVGLYSWNGTQWKALVMAGQEWNTTGNSGTAPATNFLGTADDNGILFKMNSRTAGRIENNTSGNSNTSFGAYAADSLTTGTGNTSIGASALFLNKTGAGNVAVGAGSLRSNVQSYTVAVGDSSLYSLSSAFAVGNTAVGSKALYANQFGRKNTALGFQAGINNNTGNSNVFIGDRAGSAFNFSNQNVIIGDSAATLMTGGDRNVIIGSSAGGAKTSGLENILIGNDAGKFNNGSSQNMMIGVRAGYNATGANPFPIGNQNQFIGYNAGFNQNSGTQNLFEGFQSGYTSTGGWQNTFFGPFTGYLGVNDSNNVFIGNSAGYNNLASRNQFVGFNAGMLNTTGTGNQFEGYLSGEHTSTGSYNVAAGSNSLSGNSTGSNNVAMGYHAGNTTFTGDNNMFIGFQANPSTGTLSNATAIGSNAVVGASNSLTLGGINANAVNVGIGTATPSSTLHVLGESTPPMVTIEAGVTAANNVGLRSGALRFGFADGVDKRGADMFVVDDEVHIAPWLNAAGTQDSSGFIIRPNVTNNNFSNSKNAADPNMFSAATFVNYGSYAGQVRVVSSANAPGGAYTVGLDDNVLLVNADVNLSIVLPGNVTGRYLTVKRIGGGSTITVSGPTMLIDGAASMTLPTLNQFATLVSQGSNWYVIAK